MVEASGYKLRKIHCQKAQTKAEGQWKITDLTPADVRASVSHRTNQNPWWDLCEQGTGRNLEKEKEGNERRREFEFYLWCKSEPVFWNF